jgi:hypothetical protein
MSNKKLQSASCSYGVRCRAKNPSLSSGQFDIKRILRGKPEGRGFFLYGVTGFFHWHNPSGRTMVLGFTQPLTEMSTRGISWGKGSQCVELTTLSLSCDECLEIQKASNSWNPLGLSRLVRKTALRFTFLLYRKYSNMRKHLKLMLGKDFVTILTGLQWVRTGFTGWIMRYWWWHIWFHKNRQSLQELDLPIDFSRKTAHHGVNYKPVYTLSCRNDGKTRKKA